MPKVSVIIPVYNVEEYLRQALDSVVNQTLEDLEIICVDDCSTDNSLDILKEYASKDSRFKIYQQKENQGQGVARNIALDMATGEYIAFLDPDDWIEPNMYEEMYKMARINNAHIVYSDYEFYFEDTKKTFRTNKSKELLTRFQIKLENNSSYSNKDIKKASFRALPNVVWNKLYKRDYINKLNVRFSHHRLIEDHIFSIPLKILSENNFYTHNTYYHYRVYDTSSTFSKEIPLNDVVFGEIKKFLIENNLSEEYEEEYNNYVIEMCMWKYNRYTNKKDKLIYLKKLGSQLTMKQYCLLIKKLYFSNIFKMLLRYDNKSIHGIKYRRLIFLGKEYLLGINKKG